MQTVRLGRTGLTVSRTSFGALPIQRVDFDTAKAILTRAVDAGITLIDTASGYSDSEEKIGYALFDRRDEIFIATKCSGAKNRADVLAKVERSLERMKTDHVDVLQLHNPSELPDPDDPESTYAGLVEARDRGMTRFIGITNHTRSLAAEAVESGLYDTLQFPLSAISSGEDFALAALCEKHDVGFIAMKASRVRERRPHLGHPADGRARGDPRARGRPTRADAGAAGRDRAGEGRARRWILPCLRLLPSVSRGHQHPRRRADRTHGPTAPIRPFRHS